MRVRGLCKGWGDRFFAFLSPTTQSQGSAPRAQVALCKGRGPRSCGDRPMDNLRRTQLTGLPPPDTGLPAADTMATSSCTPPVLRLPSIAGP